MELNLYQTGIIGHLMKQTIIMLIFYRLTSSSVSQSGKPDNNYYVRPVVYYGEPKESGDVCTNEKWYLYLNFVGQKNGNVCSVKQADSSIVVESSTGKRGTVTEVALSGNVNANAWSNWAEIILDPGAERIGLYWGRSLYIFFLEDLFKSPSGRGVFNRR